MSRLISKAEGFEVAYEAFQNVNFAAFDFFSIRESMIDYIRLYFAENFNDFIESSEFIALIEVFAYLGELMAYRFDMNAHENTIDFAERKQSVLRLAKLISYKASRNVPARGLVRIETITTSETVFDAKGVNLSNRVIRWNDANNPDWQEQFFIVINQLTEQNFGTVSPNERVQVGNVLFELYPLKNEQLTNGVLKYQTSIVGENYQMELVSAKLTTSGPTESRPENDSKFNIVYGSDGLGFGSLTTGFFIYTKQGSLQKITTSFDGVLPNQTYDIATDDINETDVWVNNVNPNTGVTVDDGTELSGRSGDWVEVDISNSQNIIFNTNPNRNKYEIETLENDQVRLVFGDGEFSQIPSGTFDLWYRTSVNDNIYIPKNSITDKTGAFTYIDVNNRVQTTTFNFSLIAALQNNTPSEDIEHIRRTAPSKYYTQDRMVNGRDYNVFLLQDSSILKLRAVNRTFAGESSYEQIDDPSRTYQDTKIFSDDLFVYYKDTKALTSESSTLTPEALVVNTIQPLLSSIDFFTKHLVDYSDATYRREFNTSEYANIVSILSTGFPFPLGLDYVNQSVGVYVWTPSSNIDPDVDSWDILVDKSQDQVSYIITYKGKHMVGESQTTQFIVSNEPTPVLTFESLTSNVDELIVLKANRSSDPSTMLSGNIHLNVLGIETISQGTNVGLPNYSQLTVIPPDVNGDGVPDNATLPELIGLNFVTNYSTPTTITLPFMYVVGNGETTIDGATQGEVGTVGTPSTQLTIPAGTHTVAVQEYVYSSRESVLDQFTVVDPTETIISFWIADTSNTLYQRNIGTNGLNFLWVHRSPKTALINPSTTNINDMFVITRSYYSEYVRWLEGIVQNAPESPSPTTLRNDYATLLDNKMISDSVIMHSGKIKLLVGSKAIPQLSATIKVIRSTNSALTDNQLKIRMVNIIRDFFDINLWEFGETFYFTELNTVLQRDLPSDIASAVLVPLYQGHQFGELYQVFAAEDEILQIDIGVEDIEIVQSFNASNLRQI